MFLLKISVAVGHQLRTQDLRISIFFSCVSRLFKIQETMLSWNLNFAV